MLTLAWRPFVGLNTQLEAKVDALRRQADKNKVLRKVLPKTTGVRRGGSVSLCREAGKRSDCSTSASVV